MQTLEAFRTEFDLQDAPVKLTALMRAVGSVDRAAIKSTHARNLAFYGDSHIASVHTLFAFYRGSL